MKKLPVPENITLRWELIRGLGKEEVRRCGTVFLFVLVACAVFCIISGTQESLVISVIVLIATVFLCVAFFGRLDQNQSIYDYLTRTRRFHSEQQVFLYQQKDEVIYFVPKEKD